MSPAGAGAAWLLADAATAAGLATRARAGGVHQSARPGARQGRQSSSQPGVCTWEELQLLFVT
jgi:hypothetical protein